MGAFAAGEIALVHFPFSDLRGSKLRPSVVLADVGRGDWVLCQITSKPYGDSRSIEILEADFDSGSLRLASFARPGKLFTANAILIANRIGRLKMEKFSAVRDAVMQLVKSGGSNARQ
jgi:mRNA interferase MazF